MNFASCHWSGDGGFWRWSRPLLSLQRSCSNLDSLLQGARQPRTCLDWFFNAGLRSVSSIALPRTRPWKSLTRKTFPTGHSNSRFCRRDWRRRPSRLWIGRLCRRGDRMSLFWSNYLPWQSSHPTRHATLSSKNRISNQCQPFLVSKCRCRATRINSCQ